MHGNLNRPVDPGIKNIGEHQYKQMKKARLSATFCTDNRLISKTTVSREIGLAVNHFGLDPKDLKDHIIYGFKRCFYPGPYTEKRSYIRSVINYYEQMEREYGLA